MIICIYIYYDYIYTMIIFIDYKHIYYDYIYVYIMIIYIYIHIIDSCYVSCHNLPRGIQRKCCNKRMGYLLCLPGWDLFPQEHPRC